MRRAARLVVAVAALAVVAACAGCCCCLTPAQCDALPSTVCRDWVEEAPTDGRRAQPAEAPPTATVTATANAGDSGTHSQRF